MANTLVTHEFRKRIEKLVGEAEALSSIEYVPVLTERSSNYSLFRWTCVWMVVALTQFELFYKGALLPLWEYALLSTLMGAAVFAVLGTRAGLAFALPSSFKRRAVEAAAREAFLKGEVFATHARTGVLIFVSIFEKAVFLMADKGILAKVPAHEWSALGQKLARDFSAANPGESFVEALRELSGRCSKDFPPRAQNPNELPNELHLQRPHKD